MRMNKGQPFMEVPEEAPLPDVEEARATPNEVPVFSEAFLYPRLGKGDARFVLGIAEEYAHIIDALGPRAVTAILDVRPRLADRLDVGKLVVDMLADANSDDLLWREERHPSEVRLDHHAASAAWSLLHREYQRYFDPENAMEKDALRAYHALTDGLGDWEKGERQKEIDRLPEKLKRQEERKAEIERKREERQKEGAK
jgi:hypothetical protein